jgi:hypothetical protein
VRHASILSAGLTLPWQASVQRDKVKHATGWAPNVETDRVAIIGGRGWVHRVRCVMSQLRGAIEV